MKTKTTVSDRDFISSVIDIIEEARSYGATLREVYEILMQNTGLSIRYATFLSYYQEFK